MHRHYRWGLIDDYITYPLSDSIHTCSTFFIPFDITKTYSPSGKATLDIDRLHKINPLRRRRSVSINTYYSWQSF